MSQFAYAWVNLLNGLAAANFTFSGGGTTNRAYLNDGKMDRVFTATAVATTNTLIIDLGSAQPVNCIAVLNSNVASAGGTPALKVEYADNLAFTINVVTAKAASTLNTAAPRQKDHVLQFASATKQYWRLTWTWTGSFALSIGEIFVATTTQPTRYMDYGDSEEEEIVTTGQKGASGEQRKQYIAGPFRTKTLPFSELSSTEKDAILAVWRNSKAGATTILYCHLYEAVGTAAASDNQDCIFGRIEQDVVKWALSDYGLYQPAPLKIRSVAREVGA